MTRKDAIIIAAQVAIVAGGLFAFFALAGCTGGPWEGSGGEEAMTTEATTGEESGSKGASAGATSTSMSGSAGGSTGDGETTTGGVEAEPCARLLHVGLRTEAEGRLVMIDAGECEAWQFDLRLEIWRGGLLVDSIEVPWVPAGACAAVGGSADFSAAPAWVEWTIAEGVDDFPNATVYLWDGEALVDGVWLPGDVYVPLGEEEPTEAPMLPVRRDEGGLWWMVLGNYTSCEPAA